MKKIKKILAVLLCMTAFGIAFADDGSPVASSNENVLTLEGTVGVIGFGINGVVTYNRMINATVGLGAGLALGAGFVGDADLFFDVKVDKWNFGIGGGYSWFSSGGSFMVRAIHHGESWNWGSGKGGLTLGTDWHLQFGESEGEDADGHFLSLFPRFIIGVNWVYGF